MEQRIGHVFVTRCWREPLGIGKEWIDGFSGIRTAMVLLSFVLLACSSERSVTPLPIKYQLYATAEVAGGAALDVIDAEADSVLRRIPSAGLNSPDQLEVSGDGRYLATFSGGLESGISLFDLQTEVMVASNLIRTEYASFVSGAPLLVGILSGTMYVYTIPDLSIDTVVPTDIHYFVPTSTVREVIGISRHSLPTYYGVRRYSAGSWGVIDSFTFRSPITDGPIAAFQAATSPDGERLYLIGGDGHGAAVFAIDLETHSVIFRKSVETSYGWIQATPCGEEVWIAQSFPAMFPPHPTHLGYVLMLDANTGSPLDTLRTLGMNANYPNEPLALQDILFHPDREKAYVLAFWGRPAIVVIDTRTREFSSFLYSDSRQSLWDMAIGPSQ